MPSIPYPKVRFWPFDAYDPPLVSMGTLGLNNCHSSPVGSTKVGGLIAIGYSYLCIKLQLSSSSRSWVISGAKLDTTAVVFYPKNQSCRKLKNVRVILKVENFKEIAKFRLQVGQNAQNYPKNCKNPQNGKWDSLPGAEPKLGENYRRGGRRVWYTF